MNVDSAIDFLQSQGYEVRKRNKIIYDSSFLGLEARGERLDSTTSGKVPKDDLAQLRLDALAAQKEMINRLSPNASSQIDYSNKSNQQLRDISQANKDAYCDKLEGYQT